MENGIKERLRNEVLKEMDLSGEVRDELVNDVIDRCIVREASRCYIPLKEKVSLKTELFNSIRKYDVISELLEDEDITEIMVIGTKNIFIEKNGRIFQTKKHFEDEEKLKTVIQQIVSRANRIVNESKPIADVILDDGSRINIVLDNISLNGTAVTIRKFPKKVLEMSDLIRLEAIDEKTAKMLGILVRAKYNIFISGGTGAGKTTFLNALTGFIPKEERIVTIEDVAELQIVGIENLIRLQSRNANIEGKNNIEIKDLIKSSLRMRPDRIIVGEVRDEAARDMITAMSSGHDGSLCTGHSNSVEDMIIRLQGMIYMGINLPLAAIRQQICSALDLVIQLGRLRDKTRRVLQISEIVGMKDGEIIINPIMEFEETAEYNGKIKGRLVKVNDLMNTTKLSQAGLLKIYKEEMNGGN